MHRFYVISEKHGLVAVADDPRVAQELAITATVNSARSVYLHDRLSELEARCPTSNP